MIVEPRVSSKSTVPHFHASLDSSIYDRITMAQIKRLVKEKIFTYGRFFL